MLQLQKNLSLKKHDAGSRLSKGTGLLAKTNRMNLTLEEPPGIIRSSLRSTRLKKAHTKRDSMHNLEPYSVFSQSLYVVRWLWLGTFFLVFPVVVVTAEDFVTQEVTIDQRGGSALEAREKGLQLGEKEAVLTIIKANALPENPQGTLLTDGQISGLVEDFEVFDERQSQDRYRARVAYRLKKSDLEKILGHEVTTLVANNPISPLDTQVLQPSLSQSPEPIIPQGVLIIPVLMEDQKVRLWEENNGWRTVWDTLDLCSQKDSVLFPLGDLQDMQGVEAQKAWAASGDATRNLAPRHKALGGTLIARAHHLRSSQGGAEEALEIELLWDSPHKLGVIDRFVVTRLEKDTEKSFFERAARTLLERLPAILTKPPQTASHQTAQGIRVPFTSPQGWFEMRKVLDRLRGENRLDIYTINQLKNDEAEISWAWFGDVDSLQESLRTQGLFLTVRPDGEHILEFQKNAF